MMVSLRTCPEEFELSGDWLNHIPSRHQFRFDPDGRVQIHAACNCAQLSVRAEQERELLASFSDWQTHYWRPMQINREFASHFPPRSRVRQFLIDLTAAIHRRLLRQAPSRSGVGVLHPAE
jgi:hypothetical protein